MANTKITTNVIADDAVTSDKLGGDLTMPGHVSLADNKEIRVGTGNDLVIKHSGSHTTLTNTTGNLVLAGDAVYIANAANNEYLAQFIANGAASLRYNDTEELATVSGGVYVPNKIGIGVNAPDSFLHVKGSKTFAATEEHLKIENTASGEPVVLSMMALADNGGTGNEGAIYFDAGADGTVANNLLQFSANHQNSTTPQVTIKGDGTVGIGITPSNTFSVGASGTVTTRYTSTDTSAFSLLMFENSGSIVFSADHGNSAASSDIVFKSDGAQERVRIDSAGTLKVGAVVPTPGSGWDANLDAIQVGEASAFRSGDTDYSAATVVSTNIYQTGGGDKLLNGTDYAAQYAQQGGNHYFYGYDNGSADAVPGIATNELMNPLVIAKGGGLSISGGTVGNTANGKAGIFWHTIADGADYCIRRTNDAWSGSNYAQLLIDWDTGVKIDVGNSTHGKSYLEVNGNIKFTAAGQGLDFSSTGTQTGNTSVSHLFNDYEHGVFTPSHANSITHDVAIGKYVRVGDLVHFALQVGNNWSDITSGNQFTLDGLPFPVLEAHAAGSCFARYIDDPSNTTVYVTTNEQIHLYSAESGTWDTLYISDLNHISAYFYIQGTYRTT